MMNTSVILGVVALLCFVASSFSDRTSQKRWIVRTWYTCFIVALVAQILTICEAIKTDREMKAIKNQINKQDIWGVDEHGDVFPRVRK